MSWARIDDGFDDHPKVVAILDEEDQAGAVVAVGLWTLCLTWAHRNTRKRGQMPGLLPAGLPRRFAGPAGKDAAQLLVKHKLWEPQDDGGWVIHDFGDYLPTEETRAARSEAGRRGAEKRWGSKKPPAEVAEPKQDDGKLPLDSHEVDNKPKATDGSRAPAHRATPKGVAPVPTPVPDSPSVPATVTQRSKKITDEYARVEPLCKWPAVNSIVIKAIKAERWSDDEIKAALLRLAHEQRPVTVDSLRVELAGMPPPNRVHRPYTNPTDPDAYRRGL